MEAVRMHGAYPAPLSTHLPAWARTSEETQCVSRNSALFVSNGSVVMNTLRGDRYRDRV